MLKGDSFFSKRKALLDDIDQMTRPRKTVLGFDPSVGEELRKDFLEKSQRVMSLLHLNQTLRWKLKNFLTKARIRRFQKVNETDPITLEPCKQPIYIHSFYQRKSYAFEADTISKEIGKKLTNNDGHIPSPVHPRNPFTNEDFTLSQTMSIIQQCRDYGKASWALEAFRATRYDLTSFVAVHSKPLRLQALHSTMANVTSWDCTDTLLDFIKDQCSIHSLHYNGVIYDWAVRQIIRHTIMEQWRKYCIKWYEADIIVDDDRTKLLFFAEIQKRTGSLCRRVLELQTLRTAFIKRKREVEHGSRSDQHSTSTG
jgi:hypothetical protein